ncbi:MAG: DUF3027 domain-containing protein [Jatrophihabitans sp.]
MTTSALSADAPPAKLDSAAAAATDAALAAAREVGGEGVGEHEGVRADGERVVTHRFAATLPGYRGWYWAVTLSRLSRSKAVTVDEVVLLPGEGSLLAPEWVPWSQRLQPGDLAAGDLLPTPADDPRLVPGYTATGDDSVDAAAIEAIATDLALSRPRVLSPDGRDDATDRWSSGDRGPDSPMATQAPGKCADCGFLLQIAGALRGAFGVCANEFAPADGQVVALDFGCGAHSEAHVADSDFAMRTGDVFDDEALDIVADPPAEPDVEVSEG